MSQFLHGVETIDVSKGITNVRETRSAVIGLVGTAPKGEINQLTICLSSTDDAQFGEITDNHTIPQALKSLREQGCGMVMVINVGSDANNIEVSDIIGKTTEHGKRTGIQLLADGYGTFGFDAKILIAPGFSSIPAIAGALEVTAHKIKAMAYVDTPIGLAPVEAVMSRGGVTPLGLDIHQSQSSRLRLCYPHRKIPDPVTGNTKLEPLSISWAGIRARTDKENGFWSSCSNKEIRGTLGLERAISARTDDPDTETNLLNSAGFSTVFKSFGTSWLSWGNRSAAYPVVNSFECFEQVQRTNDMIEIAIHQSSLPFVDSDIKQPQIEAIVNFVDDYLRTLKMRGAIVDGEAYFDPERNPTSELSQGHIRFGYKYTPIFPMERITYEREVTGEYLLDLKSVNMGGI